MSAPPERACPVCAFTHLQERRGLAPLRWLHSLSEQRLRSVHFADDVPVVARKR